MADEQKVSYKDTLNLPQTDFPIRPQSSIDDPALVQRWNRDKVHETSYKERKDQEKFVLHFGPPYANGHIHLGHAYSETLKDIICKSQRMQGKCVPLVPGWDCHGLPIELKVTIENPGLSRDELIKACRLYAQKWIDAQSQEFQRLGILADWQNPYITMNPTYEAEILRAFGSFVKQGYVDKKNKTVPWCASCQTVLASAEIEYQDRKDPSLYTLFPIPEQSRKVVVPELIDKDVYLVVWTTTPWTLPLNRAVLFKPKASYSVIHHEGRYFVVGTELVNAVCAVAQIEPEVVATIPAEKFEGLKIQHPFIDNLLVPVILDPFVSLEDGTAIVHCAPGCGPQDYEIALKHKLDVYAPISPDGKYTAEIEPRELAGMPVVDGQIWVMKKLTERNRLFAKTSIRHSYPHCWRCGNGLIFRATKQWFCDLERNNLRQRALQAIEKINFLPPASRGYLKATVEGRLEWCLSRQRAWGVPIPALICSNCNHHYITPELVEKVAQGVAIQGIEYWNRVSIKDLDLGSIVCTQCRHSEFTKEQDILDVWFDSGVSHYAVLKQRNELAYPADMYAEGLDQHRGWFQSSLLTSLVLEDEAAMKSILTHGFTVDEKGLKMSKSRGNVVAPSELIEKLGTDGLRLWASAIDYGGDAVVSEVLIRNVSEVYRKVRNTLRFLVSNLYDFDITKDEVAIKDMSMLDRYAFEQLVVTNNKIVSLYNDVDFTAVFHELAEYCTVHLSQFYLDIIKDRLYVEQADGLKRRSAQTVCWYILDTLTKLIAPVMSFTAELVSDHYQKDKKSSIHLQEFNHLLDVWKELARMRAHVTSVAQPELEQYVGYYKKVEMALAESNFNVVRTNQWRLLIAIRDALLKELEQQRAQGVIKHSLEARISLFFEMDKQSMDELTIFVEDLKQTNQTLSDFFKEFLVISQCTITGSSEGLHQTELKGLYADVKPAEGVKCPRCWNYDITDHADGLCRRCREIVRR
jgi:isoleucyl-tRNA synthetase